uniref:PAP1f n=1 Tax=Volvox carteri f. nagariensis TaxID=3068 RepID=D9CIW3_VOLCA|nr:PAP1f [Volvox carteri f. nagariensis]
MGSQALRTGFDLEEEERFFISGVEKAGRSRNTYEHQLRKRKVLVGVLIAIGSLGLVALIIGLAWGLSRRKLDYVCPRSYDPSKTDLVFYVIGDWGRSGNDNQQKAARLMSDVSQCMPPKFIISTGDNFYPHGLSSSTDSQFRSSFSSVYTAPGLQVPWYAVMGNHDYGDSVDKAQVASGYYLTNVTSPDQCTGKNCISPYWQIVPELAASDRRWNASLGNVVTRSFTLPGGQLAAAGGPGGGGGGQNTLDIMFVDTVPLISQYDNHIWASFLYGFKSQNASGIKSQLEQQLAASVARGAKWRLVVGHHPVRSYGSHCSDVSGGYVGTFVGMFVGWQCMHGLGARTAAKVEVKGGEPESYDCRDMDRAIGYALQQYGVAAYINGHEHDQQLIKGFVAVVLTGDTMRLHFYTTGQSGPTYTRSLSPPPPPPSG